MGKRYDKLADHLVNLDGNTFASREEAIALMKRRIQKITVEQLENNEVKVVVDRRKLAEPV